MTRRRWWRVAVPTAVIMVLCSLVWVGSAESGEPSTIPEPRSERGFTVEWQQDQPEPSQRLSHVTLQATSTDSITPESYRISVAPDSIEVIMRNRDGEIIWLGGHVRTIGDYPHHVTVTFTQDGAQITYRVWVNGTLHVTQTTTKARTLAVPQCTAKTDTAHISRLTVSPCA